MKIQIHNFGPIHFFEADLDKDLHLIIGDNNVGKSYAITVIYLMLKSIMDIKNEISLLSLILRQQPNFMDEVLKNAPILKPNEETDISRYFQDVLREILENYLVKKFQYYFIGTFNSVDSVVSIYTNEKLHIILQFINTEIEIGIDKNLFNIPRIELKKTIKAKHAKQKRRDKEKPSEIVIYYKEKEQFKNIFLRSILDFNINLIEEVITKIRSIHYLPASRSGLYQALTAFSQIVAQLSKNRSFFTEKIELPGISVPLSDYFLELSEIKTTKKDYDSHPINDIAKKIENTILKGSVEFDQKNKKLFYVPEGSNLRLDIRSTSSMVSEISPIVSFLRYILTTPIQKRLEITIHKTQSDQSRKSKALIFIEEPEAHLHPANQIELLNAFVELLNCDVKIIITSHSNYIFNKLNNLILAKKVDTAVIETTILKQSESGSIGTKLQQDELGIEDENFLGVAEQLYEEKVELIAQLNSNDR